ncbi:hypothetical protein OSB04_016871 [Centaurea solstitialis]|uniref:Integrase catalytic domain-containing protein n=1 Tax=Centaurea solstitialis TaxID=347529 RepID=A0AA38TF12_9ASTR|nr:hypothetical protein OSB04_016871 [Centaurea solstitialis]
MWGSSPTAEVVQRLHMWGFSPTAEVVRENALHMWFATTSEVKKLRSDNGTEFRNAKLQSFLEEVGISHNFSAVRTPQQN